VGIAPASQGIVIAALQKTRFFSREIRALDAAVFQRSRVS
jgi:hypothetical protein